jgi:predicted permease
MQTLVRDVRLALRGWRRRPAQVTTIVLTLSLGISATAVTFSIVDAVLLEPLPYRAPDRLAVVTAALPAQRRARTLLSGPEVAAVADRSRTLRSIGAVWARPGVLRGDQGVPAEIEVGWITPGFFETLGVPPIAGRWPTAEEQRARSDVMVLSHALWVQRYGADPAVVGARVDFDDELRTVVGVMPARFRMLFPADLDVPETMQAWLPWGGDLTELPRGFRVLTVVARLADEASWTEVGGELSALAAGIAGESVEYAPTGYELHLRPLGEALVAVVRPTLLVISGVVLVVFLVACANVANLMLSQSLERARELSIRLALGAGRARLWRQLLTESALLGIAGGVVGLWLAGAAIDLLHALGPEALPRLHDVGVDGRTLAVAAASAILAALTFGSVAAAHALAGAGSRALHQTTRGASGRMGAARPLLVVAQLSLSLMLLAGAGLLIRTFVTLSAVDLGFVPAGVVSVRLSLPDVRYPYDTGGPRIAELYRQLDARVSQLPGVRAAGATLNPPLSDRPLRPRPYAHRGEGREIDWGALAADYRTVTPGWFTAAGVRLLAGRLLDDRDRWDRPIAVVVDSTLARKAWPDADPIGQAIRVELFREAVFAPHWGEVVGVVEPVRLNGLVAAEREQIYIAHHQAPQRTMYVAVRTAGDPLAVVPAVQDAVGALEPDLPVMDVRLATDYVAAATATTRFALASLTLFAAVALTLAAAGLYAALSWAVAQRRREIGIRLALGAAPSAIGRTLIGEGLALTAAGVFAGSIGALVVTRSLAGLLHGVSPTDPFTFAAVAALLSAVGLVACWLPARRAAMVDPSETLRAE